MASFPFCCLGTVPISPNLMPYKALTLINLCRTPLLPSREVLSIRLKSRVASSSDISENSAVISVSSTPDLNNKSPKISSNFVSGAALLSSILAALLLILKIGKKRRSLVSEGTIVRHFAKYRNSSRRTDFHSESRSLMLISSRRNLDLLEKGKMKFMPQWQLNVLNTNLDSYKKFSMFISDLENSMSRRLLLLPSESSFSREISDENLPRTGENDAIRSIISEGNVNNMKNMKSKFMSWKNLDTLNLNPDTDKKFFMFINDLENLMNRRLLLLPSESSVHRELRAETLLVGKEDNTSVSTFDNEPQIPDFSDDVLINSNKGNSSHDPMFIMNVSDSCLKIPPLETSSSTSQEVSDNLDLLEAIPVLTMAVGAIGALSSGLNGGMEIIGFIMATGFIFSDLLWAAKRKELWKDLAEVTDRRKFVSLLKFRKILMER